MTRQPQTKPRRAARRTKKAAKSGISSEVAVQLSTLHYQQEYTAKEFSNLAEKFDKILERLEQLTLSSTTLISRHDTQIQTMQKQLHDTTEMIHATRDRLETNIASLGTIQREQLDMAMANMSQAIDTLTKTVEKQSSEAEARIASLSKSTDERLTKLERWRWILIGAGSAIGFVISQLVTPLFKVFVK